MMIALNANWEIQKQQIQMRKMQCETDGRVTQYMPQEPHHKREKPTSK